MAIITYGAFAALLRTNQAALAAASAPATAANYVALAELLDVLAAQKALGFSALKKCSQTTVAQLNSAS
jgi:hypothetical protein